MHFNTQLMHKTTFTLPLYSAIFYLIVSVGILLSKYPFGRQATKPRRTQIFRAQACRTRYDSSTRAAQQSALVTGRVRKGRRSERLLQSPGDGKQPAFTRNHLHSTTVTALSYKYFYYFTSVRQNRPRDSFVRVFRVTNDAALSIQHVKWEMGQIAHTSTYE